MLGTSLYNQLKYKEKAFDEKFEEIFNLEEKVLSSLSFDLFMFCIKLSVVLNYP